jgi:hypothetical protein
MPSIERKTSGRKTATVMVAIANPIALLIIF